MSEPILKVEKLNRFFGALHATKDVSFTVGEGEVRAIIGPNGAGKSTFARRLKEATGLPLYYLDAIWHRSDQTTLTKEEFDAKLEEIVRKERWIIDGNYQRTLGLRLEWCDTVFLLDYPLEVCLLGASSRIGVAT